MMIKSEIFYYCCKYGLIIRMPMLIPDLLFTMFPYSSEPEYDKASIGMSSAYSTDTFRHTSKTLADQWAMRSRAASTPSIITRDGVRTISAILADDDDDDLDGYGHWGSIRPLPNYGGGDYV